MPSFNIVKKSEVEQTYRVARVMSDFDIKPEHSAEHFEGYIQMPEHWQIGAIVGGSGTGKSSIARELFPYSLVSGFEYTAKSVIDDMPAGADINDISRMFYTVGFGSVPSWLKPYAVLSNGEKMRVDLARALLQRDMVVFDEFTSVVDRQVAQTACIAINKTIRKTGKQFVAVSCHYDILDYLQPDWVFDTNNMQMVFQHVHARKSDSLSGNATGGSGQSLSAIII